MEDAGRVWIRNDLDTVRIRDRRVRDVGSLFVAGVAVASGYLGSVVSGGPVLFFSGIGLAFVLLATVQLGMRRVEARSPQELSFTSEALVVRSRARGEWHVRFDRVHQVWTKHPRLDIVYYFNQDGWLRGFSVSKELGSRIENEIHQLETEQGPPSKPPIIFRAVVFVPWLVAGAISLGLGLPVFSSALEPVNRPLWVAGMLGIQGGIAMLLWGLLSLIWFVRERERRKNGQASALLFAGIE